MKCRIRPMPHAHRCIYEHGYGSIEAVEELHTIQGMVGLQFWPTDADFRYHGGGSNVSLGGTTPVSLNSLINCPGQSGAPLVQPIS